MQPILVLLFVSLVSTVHAQVLVQGRVMDEQQKPIPYVNIGIWGTAVGTISNEDGTFDLRIAAQHQQDSLIFSAIGYHPQRFYLPLIESPLQVTLMEQVTQLEEVTVATAREKRMTWELGNSKFRGGVMQGDTTSAGAVSALLINGPADGSDFSFPLFVEKVKLRIFRNNLEEFKIRMRLLAVDPVTGLPGPDLFRESVVQSSQIRNGWLEFDLTTYSQLVSGPFYVAFERIVTRADRERTARAYQQFIRDNPKKLQADTVLVNGKKEVRHILKGAGIDLPATFLAILSTDESVAKFTCYTRETNFDEWKKVRGIVTAVVVVSNQPPSRP